MSEVHDESPSVAGSTPRWLGIAVVVLAALSLLALGIGWSASNHARGTEQALGIQVKTLNQNVEVLTKRLGQAEETNAQLQGELNVVTDKMKLSQGELKSARRQAKQIREEYTKQLTAVEESVKSELATKASSEDVKALSGDVSGVRSDLDATKNNLQMARGELGTLIARDHEEIEQLRRLGQREYFEFTIERRGEQQKVGNIGVELRGTNPRKHQYTMALYVDDMRLEKKNKQVNEPIYFYMRGTRSPLELVVNQVSKNKVAGYLSVPKAANTSASGN